MKKEANNSFDNTLNKFNKVFYFHFLVMLLIVICVVFYVRSNFKQEEVESVKTFSFDKSLVSFVEVRRVEEEEPLVVEPLEEKPLTVETFEVVPKRNEKPKKFTVKPIDENTKVVIPKNGRPIVNTSDDFLIVRQDLEKVKKLYLDYTQEIDYNYILEYLNSENNDIIVPNNDNFANEIYLSGLFRKNGTVILDTFNGDKNTLSVVYNKLKSKNSNFAVVIVKEPLVFDGDINLSISNIRQAYYVNSSFENDKLNLITLNNNENNLVEFIIFLYYDNVELNNMSNFGETSFSAKIQILQWY